MVTRLPPSGEGQVTLERVPIIEHRPNHAVKNT